MHNQKKERQAPFQGFETRSVDGEPSYLRRAMLALQGAQIPAISRNSSCSQQRACLSYRQTVEGPGGRDHAAHAEGQRYEARVNCT